MTRTTSTRLKKLESAATIFQQKRQPRSTSLSDWYARLDQIGRTMFYSGGGTIHGIVHDIHTALAATTTGGATE